MRKKMWAAGVVLTLAAAAVFAAAADIDYSDFDEELMRSMDDAIKDLDSNVGGQDGAAALANAKVLTDGLGVAEGYFANKPQTPLGAGYARDAQQNLKTLVQSLEAKDFDAASNKVREVVRSCKACHEAYKPPE
jgi:cytochrome c556